MRFFIQYLNQLPILSKVENNTKDVGLCNKIAELSSQMLHLHQQLKGIKVAADKTALQRQIDATDEQIDRLVFELYELTPQEIDLIEKHR